MLSPVSRGQTGLHPGSRAGWLTCALILAVTITGCGSNVGVNVRSLNIWYSTDDPVEQQWATQLVHRFDQTHKNIRATIDVLGYDDFNPKMLVALGAGNPPDLAYATPRVCGIPKYVQNSKLLDLSPYARRYGWYKTLRPGLLQDYNSPFTIFATKRYGVQPQNVQVYGVPDAMAAVAVMYNVTLLRRLHLSVPRSVAELVHDVSVANAHGLVPLGLGNADGFLGDDWYQTLVNTQLPYSNLERELRIDPGFSFLGPQFRWAAGQLLAWRNDFTPNNGTLDAQDSVRQFFQGRTLFQLVSSSENSQITSLLKVKPINVGVFGFPGKTTSSTTVMPQSGYEGWVVPKQGHNPAAAVTFINWVLRPSTQTFLMKQGAVPATPASATTTGQVTSFLREYLAALAASRPGVFLDAAPIPNLNATMEANVQLMLSMHQALEGPGFLPSALQQLYAAHGVTSHTPAQIDCEF